MRMRYAIILLLILACGIALRAGPQGEKRPVKESEIQATIQAIKDEIYDLNLQIEYLDLQGPKDSRKNGHHERLFPAGGSRRFTVVGRLQIDAWRRSSSHV